MTGKRILWMRIAGALSVFFSVSACVKDIPIDPIILHHVVNVGRDGQLLIEEDQAFQNSNQAQKITVSERRTQKSIRLKAYSLEGTEQHLENIFFNIEDIEPKKITIFLHGGLNRLNESVERVKKVITRAGVSPKENYIVFINWRSGALTSYYDRLFRFRRGETYLKPRASFPIYLVSDLFKSLGGAIEAWWIGAGDAIKARGLFSKNQGVLLSKACQEQFDNIRLSCTDEMARRYTGNLKKDAQWLLLSPVNFVSTPFVYQLGKVDWQMMLRRTRTLFDTPMYGEGNPFYAHAEDGLAISMGETNGGGFARFLKKLERYQGKHKDVEINTIGHSMGAIAVTESIDRFPEIKYNNIVFMAAASSIDSFMDTIIPYLNKAPKTRFYSLMLNPQNEASELTLHGAARSGSLLVWIDGMFDSGTALKSRTLGRFSNIYRVLPEIDKGIKNKDQLRFKVFGYPHRGQNMPQTHGSFNDVYVGKKRREQFWEEAFWQ